jgi:hypothetical protein
MDILIDVRRDKRFCESSTEDDHIKVVVIRVYVHHKA